MSEGQLDKLVADEETHFLSLCRNAIVGLETQKILKKIQSNKEAATDKNKRDQMEFTGSILPDLSEVLPKVFDSSVVQVGISTCLQKISTFRTYLQEYYKKIWDHAASNKPITGQEFSDITNFVMVINLIQCPHRPQIWYHENKSKNLER